MGSGRTKKSCMRRPSLRSIEDRNKLAEQYVPFVYWCVAKLQKRNLNIAAMDMDDAVGWGMIGLIRAAELFDENRKISFGCYAGWWIRNMVQEGLTMSHNIRLPRSCFDSKDSPVNIGPFVNMVRFRFCNFDQDDGEMNFDLPAQPEPDRQHMDDAALLRRAMQCLKPVDQKIIRLRFFDDMVAKDIARKVGLSRQSVCNHIKMACSQMRRWILKNGEQ